MTETRYLPGRGCDRCAPTLRLRSGEPYRGKTSDPTARALGGIAGGAGLFSTGHDVGRFAAMLTSGGALDGVRVFAEETVREFTRVTAGERRGLGFELFCREGAAPEGAERRESCAYGHTGYTGTSLWIDPNDGIWVVLLTNRTYEPRGPNDLQPLRRAIYDRVLGNGSATGPAAASPQ
jgi:CubicO group peptidase (beta-lactamase class C family)